jgi:type IV pilus assembly protein PilA
MSHLRQRLGRDEGFTLIELLIVIVIIGILLAIAVPSYLGFKDRANNRAAQADVRAAVPSMEAYYTDNGTYVGATVPQLKSIDAGLAAAVSIPSSGGGVPTASTYCIGASVGGKDWSLYGPGAQGWHNSVDCTGATVPTP